MSKHSAESDPFFWVLLSPLILMIVGMLGFLVLTILSSALSPAVLKTTKYDVATIESVSNCHSGKYSLTCTIKSNKDTRKRDVTDYPGDYLEPGDLVWKEKREWKYKTETWYCRNNRCLLHSHCDAWMPGC